MTQAASALSRFGDVTVRLAVELGRADMPLRDVLSLAEGSVVALDRLTDELLDVTANGRIVAHGEVVAQDGRFALRIVRLAGEDPAPVSPRRADTGGGAPAALEPNGAGSIPDPASAPVTAHAAMPDPAA